MRYCNEEYIKTTIEIQAAKLKDSRDINFNYKEINKTIINHLVNSNEGFKRMYEDNEQNIEFTSVFCTYIFFIYYSNSFYKSILKCLIDGRKFSNKRDKFNRELKNQYVDLLSKIFQTENETIETKPPKNTGNKKKVIKDDKDKVSKVVTIKLLKDEVIDLKAQLSNLMMVKEVKEIEKDELLSTERESKEVKENEKNELLSTNEESTTPKNRRILNEIHISSKEDITINSNNNLPDEVFTSYNKSYDKNDQTLLNENLISQENIFKDAGEEVKEMKSKQSNNKYINLFIFLYFILIYLYKNIFTINITNHQLSIDR